MTEIPFSTGQNPAPDDYLLWADISMHPRWGTEHFLITGASGSGKTALIEMLMKSVIGSTRPIRSIVYDAKQEVLPALYALTHATESEAQASTSRVKVLHPLDARCLAWDLSKDIIDPISARQLATILVPESTRGGDAESFFTSAVRDLLTGVILVFINCTREPCAWTLRDVLLGMLYEPYLRFLLSQDKTRDDRDFPMVTRLRENYLDGEARTVQNIRSTINTKLSIYEPIGAAWELARKGGRTFSLTEWVKDTSQDILVLGNDEAARVAVDSINQAIFKRASELILARRELSGAERENASNQTWIFLDEVREAGTLNGLSRLLTKGRSKGACVVIGFQDIDGLRAVYEANVANEICGQCNNVAVLRMNSPTTAEWACELFGKRLTHSQGGSRSLESGGKLSRSSEIGEQERPYVYTSDLLYLPPAGPESGITGYFRSPNINPEEHELRVNLDPEFVASKRPIVPSHAEGSWQSAYLPRNSADFYLWPWDEKDKERLHFEEMPPNWKKMPTDGKAQRAKGQRETRPESVEDLLTDLHRQRQGK